MAIGFETTAPSTAMTMLRAAAEAQELLGVLQPRDDHPAIRPFLTHLTAPDGLVGPGHVSTVIGCGAV
jgi:hydrogenase expression/formation protein HypD